MSINEIYYRYITLTRVVMSSIRSFHSLLQEWKRVLPYIQPCYSISNTTTKQSIELMRNHRIPMLCETPDQVQAANDYTLTIEASRFGNNEYITRARPNTTLSSPTIPLWVYTKISHDGVDETQKVFEEIWAHKHILKGIVFDVRNFADTTRNSITPPLYSYKIAMDYVLRNIVIPFEKEYGIYTPCIMMDGCDNITRPEHLHELRGIIKQPTDKRGLILIVDELFNGYSE
jgi:hypothetical protein